MNATQHQQATGFFTLPAEIRLVIYSLTFGFEETTLPRWPHGRPSRSVQLLRTCRAICNEARPVLYTQTTLVLHGRGLHPFPVTIDRHLKNPEGRNMLREVTILEPRVIPYRYKAHQFPPRKRVTDWTFNILRHLPGLRTVTITDVSPIVVILPGDVSRSDSILAVEYYISYQMSRALLAFKGDQIKRYHDVYVILSARLVFNRSVCLHRPTVESSICAAGCADEVVARVRVHPVHAPHEWDQDRLNAGREVLRLSIELQDASGDDAWFPVRCL